MMTATRRTTPLVAHPELTVSPASADLTSAAQVTTAEDLTSAAQVTTAEDLTSAAQVTTAEDLTSAAQVTTTEDPAAPVQAATAPRRRRVRVQRPRSAASVGWWGLSLIVASLGVVVLIGATTFEHVGRRDVAIPVLTAGLQQPTERLLLQELARDDAGPRVTARADLVAFDIDRDDALADPSAAARAAAEQRAVELYDNNQPADPGFTRTELGISRSLVGVMSEQNHAEVAKSRMAAAIFALALLAWCFLQAKDDNMLLLPACALAGGWLLATAAKKLVVQLIGDVNGASDTYVRSFEAAAAQPLALAKTAALGLLAGAALYRFATIARHHLARRALVPAMAPGRDPGQGPDLRPAP